MYSSLLIILVLYLSMLFITVLINDILTSTHDRQIKIWRNIIMMATEGDFIFVGWNNNGPKPLPIIAPIEIYWKVEDIPAIIIEHERESQSRPGGGIDLFNFVLSANFDYPSDERYVPGTPQYATISVDQLYKLPNVRNINMYYLIYRFGKGGVRLLGRKMPNIITFICEPQSPLLSPQEWYEINRPTVTYLEQEYPGLFQPVFVHPEVGGGRKKNKKTRRRSSHN